MGHRSDGEQALLLENPRTYFSERVEGALNRLGFQPLPASRHYLVSLLEHYVFSSNLHRETLAELWLRAQNSPPPLRTDLLKQLGDGSLYISGFFGDSLSRKVVDIGYYVDMGGVAYAALASSAADESQSKMYGEFSVRFPAFVDVLTYISQSASLQTNEDLLKLYDRYMATGSRLAEEHLAEKGLLNADLQKAKNKKM
jgi:hypothetical protein